MIIHQPEKFRHVRIVTLTICLTIILTDMVVKWVEFTKWIGLYGLDGCASTMKNMSYSLFPQISQCSLSISIYTTVQYMENLM